MTASLNIWTILFYAWWVLINSFIYYSEWFFLLRFKDVNLQRKLYLVTYIGINCVLTFFSIFYYLPDFICELLHISILLIHMKILLKCKWIQVITPTVIIFTLSTFMDSISFVTMKYSVYHINSIILGNLVHILLTVILVFLYFLTLRLIAKRYKYISQQINLPYIYVLLLPCAFVVWIIRFGLGLDSGLGSNFAFYGEGPPYWAIVCIIGALATFFIILEVFGKVLLFSRQETEKALLDAELREQQIYIDEAEKRDERYHTFKHDIKNLLLVLSGLLKEKKYNEAELYFSEINLTYENLFNEIDTGNSVLNVLLKEKVKYAEQNKIKISLSITLPDEILIKDIDLCVIFANALDNAIQANLPLNKDSRTIDIIVKTWHQFLLIEVRNPYISNAPILPGTGMKNIKATAEKYHGTMSYETEGNIYRLNIILSINKSKYQPFTQ